MRSFLANLFLFLGILLLVFSGYLVWQRNSPIKEIERQNYSTDSSPQELIIEELQIKLPILGETTTEGISHLTTTPLPGEPGNSVLYGHNWPVLLSNLTKAKPGQKLQIKYSDNSEKIFMITTTQVVSPNQIGVIDQTTDTRITLYTCIGFLDRERFVVTAMPYM